MKLESVSDVLMQQLSDLHSAEQQLVTALPKMSQAASNEQLRQAFDEHLVQTRNHVERLQTIFDELGAQPSGESCKAMQGLIAEGEEVIQSSGDPAARDVALIGAAQRVEHYEIAAYGTARTLADELEYSSEKDLLDKTLDEESEADKLLTRIATGGLFKEGVNRQAAD
jgi:ferritin-like metal-binding protein YciE